MLSLDSKMLSEDWKLNEKKMLFRRDGHNKGEGPIKMLKKLEDNRPSNSKTGKEKKKWKKRKWLWKKNKDKYR